MKLTSIAAAVAAVLASANASAAADFQWSHQWTFNHTAANGSSAMGSEIVSFDAVNNRLWVAGTDANQANIGQGGIDVLDMNGNLLQSISTSAFGGINSVAGEKRPSGHCFDGADENRCGVGAFLQCG
ncbi:hypothetical protein CWO84_02665 [Methylomonas sp. Kb3]|uniref:hypothetical protein n=1 Tax=Methylomonas sp. Kb3 TaxID=1611544 RepID=UPI000C34F07E|nr:hypothetical protein [Methylomonas sp. Kb3]PKD41946.1 hypothetical protein CWO84_02665 [Methylomonas sp. Kb3]